MGVVFKIKCTTKHSYKSVYDVSNHGFPKSQWKGISINESSFAIIKIIDYKNYLEPAKDVT